MDWQTQGVRGEGQIFDVAKMRAEYEREDLGIDYQSRTKGVPNYILGPPNLGMPHAQRDSADRCEARADGGVDSRSASQFVELDFALDMQ